MREEVYINNVTSYFTENYIPDIIKTQEINE